MIQKRFRYTSTIGFTLVEVVVVMGIMGILLALATPTLFRSQQRISIDTTLARLIGDSREQQMRALSGDTAPFGSYIDYSIRFEDDRYTLFSGSVYVSGSESNTVVILGGPLVLADVTFPSSTLTFSRSSGEVSGFITGQNSFVLKNSQTGEEKIVSVNKRGVFSVTQ